MGESTRGKMVMLLVPLVATMPALSAASTMPRWLQVLGFGTILLAEVGAVCFFFPDQTVSHVYRWRAHRAALSSGALRTEDVNRLLMRYARQESHHVQHHLLNLIPAKARQDATYGLIARDWIRRRRDLALLDDALTTNLAPTVLADHLRGTKPLDPSAVATLAALVRKRETRDDDHGGLFMLTTGTPTGRSAFCQCDHA